MSSALPQASHFYVVVLAPNEFASLGKNQRTSPVFGFAFLRARGGVGRWKLI